MRPTRWQVAGLALVALLAGIALALGSKGDRGVGDGASPAELAALRREAALEPCPPGLGPGFPDLVLPCLGGGPDVRLRAAAPGVPTVVNIWGTWCPPCVAEVPDLVRFADKARGRVKVVGILMQDTQERGLLWSRDRGVPYASLVDDEGTVLRSFQPGPPVTLLLDASGRVVHKRSGKLRDYGELRALVAEHLGVVV